MRLRMGLVIGISESRMENRARSFDPRRSVRLVLHFPAPACSLRHRLRITGSPDHWITGSPDHWITGSLDHRITVCATAQAIAESKRNWTTQPAPLQRLAHFGTSKAPLLLGD